MKKLLLGLLVLGSFSTFASDKRECGAITTLEGVSASKGLNDSAYVIINENTLFRVTGTFNASILATAKALNKEVCLTEKENGDSFVSLKD